MPVNCKWVQIDDKIECVHCGKILTGKVEDGPIIECGTYDENPMAMLGRLSREYQKWFKAGMPTRSIAQIEEIFEKCCGCEFFGQKTEEKGSCTICNCQIKRRSVYMNKAALETSYCPLMPPKWGKRMQEIIHNPGGMGTIEDPPNIMPDVKIIPQEEQQPIVSSKRPKPTKLSSVKKYKPQITRSDKPRPKRRSCCD
jgi:hypothetical protein